MEVVWRCRPPSSSLQIGSCMDGEFILLKFRQLHRPVTDVKIQFVTHPLRGQTKACKPNVNAADHLCWCFSFSHFLSPFVFTLSQMLRQTTGVYVVDVRSFHTSQSVPAQISFMLIQHLCSNQIWVISNCIILVNMPGKITDKLASRWRVTCWARRNALAVTAWHQGLPRNVVAPSAVTCSATGDVTGRDRNGEIDHVRLQCQDGWWLSACALITM